jgi:hypothetical protein
MSIATEEPKGIPEENRHISERLSMEVKKLLFSESMADKIVGFEIGLMTSHGWFLTWDVNGETAIVAIGSDGAVLGQGTHKTFQGVDVKNDFYINRILVSGSEKNLNHEEMRLMDQIFFDSSVDGYLDVCTDAHVVNSNDLKLLKSLVPYKDVYNKWKTDIAAWYAVPDEFFSYVFFPICRSSRYGGTAIGSLFLGINSNSKTNDDFVALLARCHTLRISLNFLIEHQFGQDVIRLLSDRIKARISKFIKLTITQPPKGSHNGDYQPGWFAQGPGHGDDDDTQRKFIQEEFGISSEPQSTQPYGLDQLKGLFETSINPDSDFIVRHKIEYLSVIPLAWFQVLLSYFELDSKQQILITCNREYIGLPCKPGWVFAAGLVLLIGNLKCRAHDENAHSDNLELQLDCTEAASVGNEKRLNWSLSFPPICRDDRKDGGAFGLVKSLYYGKRKGDTAQNLHDFSLMKLSSPEFKSIAGQFSDKTQSAIATLLTMGADSPVIYYSIEDATVNEKNYINVKIHWASPLLNTRPT